MSYYIDQDEYIYVKNDSLPDHICKYLINLFENDASHLVYNGVVNAGIINNNTMVSDIKKTRDLVLTEDINKYDDYLFQEVTSNINKYFEFLNMKYNKKIIPLENANDTGYTLQKYTAKNGIFSYHHDSCHKEIDSRIQTRILAFIWYLNTVEEGGETEFLNGRYKINPEKGKLTIFPATWTYMHQGNMPISEDKYIVTGWLNGNIW